MTQAFRDHKELQEAVVRRVCQAPQVSQDLLDLVASQGFKGTTGMKGQLDHVGPPVSLGQ